MHLTQQPKSNSWLPSTIKLTILCIVCTLPSCKSDNQHQIHEKSTEQQAENKVGKPIYQLHWIGIPANQDLYLGSQDTLKLAIHNVGAPTNTDELLIKFTNTQNFTFKLGNKKGSNIPASLTAIIGRRMDLASDTQMQEMALQLAEADQALDTTIHLTIHKGNEQLATQTITWHRWPVEIVKLPAIITGKQATFKLKNISSDNLPGNITSVEVISNNNSQFAIIGCHQEEYREAITLSNLFGIQVGLIPGTCDDYKQLSAKTTTGNIRIGLVDAQGEKVAMVTILVKHNGKLIGRTVAEWELAT